MVQLVRHRRGESVAAMAYGRHPTPSTRHVNTQAKLEREETAQKRTPEARTMCLRGSDAWCAERFGSSQCTSASNPLMKPMPPKRAAVAIK